MNRLWLFTVYIHIIIHVAIEYIVHVLTWLHGAAELSSLLAKKLTPVVCLVCAALTYGPCNRLMTLGL